MSLACSIQDEQAERLKGIGLGLTQGHGCENLVGPSLATVDEHPLTF